jgi:hypothetical protein
MFFRQLFGVAGIPPERDEDALLDASVGQRAEELPHGFHADIPCFPLLALHRHRLAGPLDDEINAAIRVCPAPPRQRSQSLPSCCPMKIDGNCQ